MEVKVNYLQDGQLGSVTATGDSYETARDKAIDLKPAGAQLISIMVDR